MNIKNYLESVRNLLDKNNTTTATYNLSDGLNKKVTRVYKGLDGMYERTPVITSLYPVVFVELNGHDEDYDSIGNKPSRVIGMNFNIVAVTMYGAGTSSDSVEAIENSQMECIDLISNIKNIIRNTPVLSQTTVVAANITNTDYGVRVNENYVNNVIKSELTIQIKDT